MSKSTLTKFNPGDVLYKKVLGKAGDLNVGEMTKKIAEDAGAMIKVSPLQKAAEEIKEADPDKPVVHLGVAAGDLVLSVQGADGFKFSETIVKGYAKIKENRSKDVVINAQKGDDVIDKSSDRMAKAKGTKAQDYEDADLTEVKGDIVILAHGANVGKSPGQVYAKEFGDKKPKEIVEYLVKTKKLPKTYSGTVYLDGCYTAAGPQQGKTPKELNNFCKTVYEGLKKAGYLNLQVKGNLGLATTKDDGKEDVVDAQMEKEIEKRVKPIQKKIDEQKKKREKLMTTLGATSKKINLLKSAKKLLDENTTMDSAKKEKALKSAEENLQKAQSEGDKINKVMEELDKDTIKLQKERAQIKEDLKKQGISDEKIEDLVGTFGPEKL